MATRKPLPSVQVATADDGTLTYLVAVPPEALPPVRLRDLAAAWDAARDAALDAPNRDSGGWDSARLFRFRRADGGFTDLALADPDAQCWAGAVERSTGMTTLSGLSLCLRLLALVDLLARARWAAGLFALKPEGADIDPALLQAASLVPLTPDARFDETGFRARVQQPRLPTPSDPLPSGASA